MASPTSHAEITPHEAPQSGQSNRLRRTLFSRELPHYPPTSKRLWYLFVVIAATVLLYYQLYVQGAVGPSILRHYGMSFKYYVYISVIGNVFGALASVVAGIADRVGRANIIAWGLGVTSVLDGFVLPHMPNKWAFAVVVAAVSGVEGLILVATPALVRDFSPQLGRASAMGFWTLGPVLGSLCLQHLRPLHHAERDLPGPCARPVDGRVHRGCRRPQPGADGHRQQPPATRTSGGGGGGACSAAWSSSSRSLTVMGGFWSPAAARRRAQEHERAVQAELKQIEATG